MSTTTASQPAAPEREALQDLLSIGGQMANVCFNWSQEANYVGATLGGNERNMLDNLRREWDAARAAIAHREAVAPKTLTDDQIDRIAENCAKAMPDGIRGFCRVWGWRQFARELLDVCAGHVRAAPISTQEDAQP